MDYRRAANIDPADFSKLKQDCVLFYHPSCKPLAEKIAASGSDISLGKIDWGFALCSLCMTGISLSAVCTL